MIEEGRFIHVAIRGDRAPEFTLPHVAMLEFSRSNWRLEVRFANDGFHYVQFLSSRLPEAFEEVLKDRGVVAQRLQRNIGVPCCVAIADDHGDVFSDTFGTEGGRRE